MCKLAGVRNFDAQSVKSFSVAHKDTNTQKKKSEFKNINRCCLLGSASFQLGGMG